MRLLVAAEIAEGFVWIKRSPLNASQCSNFMSSSPFRPFCWLPSAQVSTLVHAIEKLSDHLLWYSLRNWFLIPNELVDSLDCYRCFSSTGLTDSQSYYHPECEKGWSSNITISPCKESEGQYCYKVEGVGRKYWIFSCFLLKRFSSSDLRNFGLQRSECLPIE